MTGPVSIFAITEMNQRAEDALAKVRKELFRIGCGTDNIRVLRQGYYLQLRFRHQIVLADPGEVLGILEKIPAGRDEVEAWEQVASTLQRTRKQSRGRVTWGIASVLITTLLILFLILVRG